jgi:hypothetical protein
MKIELGENYGKEIFYSTRTKRFIFLFFAWARNRKIGSTQWHQFVIGIETS